MRRLLEENSGYAMNERLHALEEDERNRMKGITRVFATLSLIFIASVAVSGYVRPFWYRPRVMDYVCPANCLGVVRVEDQNQIETVNLKTGRHHEWRFCKYPVVASPSPPSIIFKGYVIEIHTIETGFCEALNQPGLEIHLIRGKEMNYKPVGSFTHFDGADRPVLANNCQNSPDDSTTICEGGDARFAEELSQR